MTAHGFATRPEAAQAEQTSQQKNTEIDPKVFQQKRKPPSMFSAPVPGESLTGKPKNMPFEHPPQFTDIEEATEFVWDQLNNRNTTLQLLALLDKQTPVDGLAKTILFTGFASGKWTPDLAILMVKPVVAMIVAIGKGAGINVRMRIRKKSKSQENLEAIINMDTGNKNA